MTAWEVGGNVDTARLNGSLAAFYRDSRDTVHDARSFADGVLVTARQNGGQARSAGMSGDLDWTLDPALQLGGDGGAYCVVRDTPGVPALLSQHGISGYLSLKTAYRSGTDDLSLDSHAQSAEITALGGQRTTSSVNLTWRHRLSKTLSLTANANDIFDGSQRTYRTDTGAYRQTGFDHCVARRIYIGFVEILNRLP